MVKRVAIAEQSNCELALCTTRHVSTYDMSASAAADQTALSVDTVEVTIPVLTNTKDISAGEELAIYWQKKEKASSAPKKKTWHDEAAQEYRQIRKAPRS